MRAGSWGQELGGSWAPRRGAREESGTRSILQGTGDPSGEGKDGGHWVLAT